MMMPEIQALATGNPEDDTVKLVKLSDYASRIKTKKHKDGNALSSIALVNVSGSIVDSDKTGARAGATEISKAIGEAIADDSINNIVVRVNSPGGSPTASETIRRAIQKARAKGKKVIISMGPVAASGGYWIAAETDRIFASQATLTGSIGVVMGKFEASDLWQKVGINWEGPQVGANADIWSINQPFDSVALNRLNILIDETYEAFIMRVAKGRSFSPEQTREIAKGRVYTGAQALQLNLVDEIGGLENALDYAAQQIGAENRYGVLIKKFPKELNGIERFMKLLGQEVGLPQFMTAKINKNHGFESKILKQAAQISDEMILFGGESPIAVYDPLAASVRTQ